MANVLWLESSLDDLKRINAFLAEKNPDAASRALNTIVNATKNLQDYPELGKPYESDIAFRELFVPFGARGYMIHYRLNMDDVVIVQVWHAREERL